MITDNVVPFRWRPRSERTAENMARRREVMELIFGPHLPQDKEGVFDNDDDSGPEAA